MLDIVIIGAGGFGREVYNFANDSYDKELYRIKGYIDDNPNQLDDYDIDIPILATIEDYRVQDADRFIVAIGNVDTKKAIVTKLKEKGARFINLIHPTAYVASSSRLGEGVVMCPFSLVSDHGEIGDFVMLHNYASCGHDSKIGKFGILSPYATVNGFCKLGDEVFMGTHATITAYRKVGTRSKINANSVAMADVPQSGFVYGVPGKIKVIFTHEES